MRKTTAKIVSPRTTVRASAHSDELREFSIDESGIKVGHMLDDQEGLLGGRPTRKHLGAGSTPLLANGLVAVE